MPRQATMILTALLLIGLWAAGLGGLPRASGAAPQGPTVAAGLAEALAGGGRARVILSVAEAHERLDEAEIARRQQQVLATLGPGFALERRYRGIGALAGRLGAAGLARLAASDLPGLAVAPDPVIHAYLDESLPFVGADKLRRQGVTGKGLRVVVMDTGVDAAHLDLKDAVVEQLCSLVPRDRCGPAGKLADDLDGHGTHVAGIIASRGKKAGFGMAPGAEIVALKFLEERNTGAGSDMVAALDALLGRDDIDIINMSLGSTWLYEGSCNTADAYTRSLAQAFGKLRAKGIISVAASGNDGSPNKMGAPACIDEVISVGAVTIGPDASLAEFTNRSATLDLLAPGVDIDAPVPGNDVGAKSGTSMAAPHVAGALALLKQAAPWAGQDTLEAILKANGQRPTTTVGGHGVSTLKVDKALAALRALTPTATRATDPPPTPSATPTATATATTAPSATPSPTATEALAPTVPASPSAPPSPPLPTATRVASPTAPPPTVAPGAVIYLPLLRRAE